MKHIKTIRSEAFPDQCVMIVNDGEIKGLFYKAGSLVLKSLYETLEAASEAAKHDVDQVWPSNPVEPIKLEVTVDNVFAADIIETAMLGGIDYWAEGKVIHSDDEGKTTVVMLKDSTGEGYDGLPAVLDLNTIRKGIVLAMEPDNCRQDIKETILTAVVSDDVGQIDAEAADVIVQLGLFEEVVFG